MRSAGSLTVGEYIVSARVEGERKKRRRSGWEAVRKWKFGTGDEHVTWGRWELSHWRGGRTYLDSGLDGKMGGRAEQEPPSRAAVKKWACIVLYCGRRAEVLCAGRGRREV